MSLREDIELDRDFVLVSTSAWFKLVTAFGGAPEIPIYQYTIEEPAADGSVVKRSLHDFSPIKVNVTGIDSKTRQVNCKQTVLASPFLTNKFFLSQIVAVINDMSTAREMFVVRPYQQEGDNLPVIYRVPQTVTKLFECGVQEGADVAILCN